MSCENENEQPMNGIASDNLIVVGWICLGLYMALILFFVIRGALRIKNISDYAVGSVHFSPAAVGLSLAASMTSAATFIINPGFVAYYGLSGVISMAIFLPLGALISLVVLTKSFRKIGKTASSLTIAQWIGQRYKSKNYAFFFAILSLLLITFIVLICVGLTKVIAGMLNLPELGVLIGIVVFVFGYMMFGGANSMVYTNMIQALMMVLVAIILLGSGYEHFSNGVHGFLAKLEDISPNLAAFTNTDSFLFRDWFEIAFCQIVVGIAVVCQPHIITKSLLLKKEKEVNRYLFVGIVAEILFFSVVFVGLYARIAFPDLQLAGSTLGVDGVVSAYVINELPVVVSLVVILGLISAGLSTLEGLIQSLSSTITSDILGSIIKKQSNPIITNRLVIVGLGIVSILISYNQLIAPDLSVGIFAQNGVYAYFTAAFIPVLFGIFMKEVPVIVPLVGTLTALLVHFGTYYGRVSPYMEAATRNPAIAATYAILSSLIVSLVLWGILKIRKAKTTTPLTIETQHAES